MVLPNTPELPSQRNPRSGDFRRLMLSLQDVGSLDRCAPRETLTCCSSISNWILMHGDFGDKIERVQQGIDALTRRACVGTHCDTTVRGCRASKPAFCLALS